MLGPDHAASLEFNTFKDMADTSRKVFLSLGSNEKKFLKSEKVLHNVLIRKFVTRDSLKKGQKLNKFNIKTALTYSRSGMLPKDYYRILNKKTVKDLKAGHIIRFSDIK